jgi:hypothetical protein
MGAILGSHSFLRMDFFMSRASITSPVRLGLPVFRRLPSEGALPKPECAHPLATVAT